MEQEYDYEGLISKKQLVIGLSVILAIATTLFLTFFLLLNNRINKLHENEPENQSPVFNQTDNNEEILEYTVKEFDGKIGVFKNGDFQYSLDVYVFTLPENDKKLLTQGIKASSEQELNDILSTYY